MEEALAAQLRAYLPDAERLYRAALAIDPHAADALHMLGAICYQTGRLLEAYTLIREALERTDWRFPMFRHNFALVLSSMLATDDAVEAMLSGDEELGARIEADSRLCAKALGVHYAGPLRAAAGKDAVTDSARANILVIDDSVPAPDRDSGSVRLVAVLGLLRALGCNVTFVARGVEFGSSYVQALRDIGVEVLGQPDIWNIRQVLAARGREFDLVWACKYRSAQECVTAVRRCAPQALFVLDTVDVHFIREAREAGITGDPAVRRRSAVTRELELAMVREADVTLVVSERERSALLTEVPDADVRIVSNVQPTESSTPTFVARRDMVFVGAFGHNPNVDAIKWYATEVWPQVRDRLPGARTFVIGSDMPEAVRSLAGQGMEAVGFAPDLAPYLQHCRLSIAPLRYGAGVKGKISAAQAAGLPVVATSIAIEGMNLEPGRDVLVADTAEAFADAVVRLHEDEVLWTRVASGGRENVARHFSAEVARPVLAGLIEAATTPRGARAVRPAEIRYLILVPAAYGSLGDSAMVHGAVEGIRSRFPNAQIDLLSIYHGERWHRIPGIGKVLVAFPLACTEPQWEARFRRIVADYDCFALLGADVLDGHYSADESLARLALVRLADNFGLETRVLGFSMNERPAEAACAALREIGAFAPLFVRDPLSLSRLDSLGVPGLIPAADVAFLMRPDSASPSCRSPRAWIEEQRAAGRPVIALGLSSPVLAEAMQAGKADLLQNCVALIVALARSHHASVLILPHDLRPGPTGLDDDVAIAYRISAMLDAGANPVPHYFHVTCNAPEVKGLVGLVDLALTGRMHLAIAALGMAVPVVALAYQGKFVGMMRRFDLEKMAFDPQSFDLDAMYACCARLLEDTAAVKAALRQRLPEVLALAQVNFAATLPRQRSTPSGQSAAD
jgi:polysaccharide pyruvyl transferase WcaK-like protein/glycosyltransferase involved in cell wall biosynthesis